MKTSRGTAAVAACVVAAAVAFTSAAVAAPDTSPSPDQRSVDPSTAKPLDAPDAGNVEQFSERLNNKSGATSKRAPAAVAEPPVFVSPAPGSTVVDTVTVVVTSDADEVRLSAPQLQWEHRAPVAGGSVSFQVPTAGSAPTMLLYAQNCVDGQCSGTETQLSLKVQNTPATLVGVTNGQTVGTSFTVATPARVSGSVRVSVDGVPKGLLQAPDWAATIDTGTGNKNITVRTEVCNEAGTVCAQPYETYQLTRVSQLLPKLNIAPSRFSPNGDKRKDVATIRYTLDRPQNVTLKVVRQNGKTVAGPFKLGSKKKGTHRYKFNGKISKKKYLSSGRYTVRLDSTAVVAGSQVKGAAEKLLVVDVKKPNAKPLKAATVFPVRDKYKDTTKLRFRASEQLAWLHVEVRNSSNKVVWKKKVNNVSGTRSIKWNGRRNNGKQLPAGTYKFSATMQDTAGNRGKSKKRNVKVSPKKLVRITDTKRVKPEKTAYATSIGDCSEVMTPASSGRAGSIGYYSNYYLCFYPYDIDLIAGSWHQTKLPGAVRYGNVRVDTYGGKTLSNYNDSGFMLYAETRDYVSDRGTVLKPGWQWHKGPAVSGERFVKNRMLRWTAGTSDEMFYDVEEFRITYTRFVLR